MLTSIALIMIFGLALSEIFKKLRLPGLIGMLITGIVLGPHVLNLLDDSILSVSGDLREAALVIILLRAGLALDPGDLKRQEDLRRLCALCLPASRLPAWF